MQKITDILTPISNTLGLTFIRSMDLSEANIDMHYDSNGNDLMIYNGIPSVSTLLGAEAIDVSNNEIYFLRVKPSVDMKGEDLEGEYQEMKRLVDQSFRLINMSDSVARDVATYELEAVEVGTDMYIGYLMKISISTYNTCGTAPEMPGCPEVSILNSDASYDETEEAGGVHTLPDITVTKQDDTTTTYPAAKDLDVDDFNDVCAVGTAENTDQSYQDTVASGGTLVIPDINITKNDDSVVTSPAAIDLDLRIIDPCEIPITWDEMAAHYGRGYVYPKPTEATSYRTGDAEYIETNFLAALRVTNETRIKNSLLNFFTLHNNNSFGNKNRFTDSVGGQNYDGTGGSLNLYIVDNYTGLATYDVNHALETGDWDAAIDNSLGSDFGGSGTFAATLGFTDWFLPYITMLEAFIRWGNLTNTKDILDHEPFRYAVSLEIFSGTTYGASTTSVYILDNGTNDIRTEIKANVNSFIPCRIHFQ